MRAVLFAKNRLHIELRVEHPPPPVIYLPEKRGRWYRERIFRLVGATKPYWPDPTAWYEEDEAGLTPRQHQG